MFEQTFLTQADTPGKTRALAASFVAQITLLGVLLLGPLLFTRALPFLLPEHVFVEPPVLRQPELPLAKASTGSSSTSPSTPRVLPPRKEFTVPTRVPRGPVLTDVPLDTLLPGAIDSAAGVPAGLGNPLVGVPGGALNLPAPPQAKTSATASPAQPAEDKRIVVSGGVQAAKLIKRVLPVYPKPARLTRVSGIVHLLALIGKDGHVEDVRAVEGHPLLLEAAREAVRQWIYTPTYLSGNAVEVETAIDVHFDLQ